VNDKPRSIDQWLAALGNPSADRDYKPGHERLKRLLEQIHQHKPALRIRVAGTNGKGSTSFMLAAALQSCGLKTGLYTSPHILEFNERIRINGKPINSVTLQASLERLMPAAIAAGASYFETATALALDHFAQEKVDIEILEAGVGARLDATTALPADMALITPVGIDHQAWLGDTVQEIASEKAHAMQGCAYAISAPQQPEALAALKQFNPGLILCEQELWKHLEASGQHQQDNASLAYAAIRVLKQAGRIDCNLAIAKAAIASCRIPGRLEKITVGSANIWLDAAHNRHAIEALLPSLPALAAPFDAILVFTREDRSLENELDLLKPYCHVVIGNAGAEGALEQLKQQLTQHPKGSFLVLGSFITVAEILCHQAELH